MSRISFVPFSAGHLECFAPGPFDQVAMEEPYLSTLCHFWPGRAISAIRGQRTLGIAGAAIRHRRAYPWMILSEEMRRNYPIFLCKSAQIFLGNLFKNEGVECIEISIRRKFHAARRWAQRLGFEAIESDFRDVRYIKYGCGRSFFQPARRHGNIRYSSDESTVESGAL